MTPCTQCHEEIEQDDDGTWVLSSYTGKSSSVCDAGPSDTHEPDHG